VLNNGLPFWHSAGPNGVFDWKGWHDPNFSWPNFNDPDATSQWVSNLMRELKQTDDLVSF
jgi:hypothetical protein